MTPSSKLLPILIVPDVHAPYHNKRAVRLMLRVAKDLKPHTIVILGDLADCYSISDYDKDPARANQFEWEIDECNALLDDIDSLGASRKVFIEGNHEDRLPRLLKKHSSLYGVVNIPKLLKLKERKWSWTNYKDHIAIGKIHYTHDAGGSARNHKFKALDLYQHSVVTGHDHRMIYVVEGNAVGNNSKLSCGFGWLGDTEQVDYTNLAKARHDWALGFGVGYFDPATGFTYLTPVPILSDYSCVFNGKLYRETQQKGDVTRRKTKVEKGSPID